MRVAPGADLVTAGGGPPGGSRRRTRDNAGLTAMNGDDETTPGRDRSQPRAGGLVIAPKSPLRSLSPGRWSRCVGRTAETHPGLGARRDVVSSGRGDHKRLECSLCFLRLAVQELLVKQGEGRCC